MNATAASCNVVDEDCGDLQCTEKFESSDSCAESEPESDSENETMYETETDEGHTTSDMDTDTEEPRTYRR